MWRYGGVTEEKKKSMGRYPWNLRPEKSKKPRVATHGLFGAFKEKQGNKIVTVYHMSKCEIFETLEALKNLIYDYRDGNFEFNEYSDDSEDYEHEITTPPRKCKQIQQKFESFLEEKTLNEKEERQLAEFDNFVASHYFSKWNSNLLRNLVMNKAGRIARANTPVVSDDHANEPFRSGSPQKRNQCSQQNNQNKSPQKTYPNHKVQTSNISGNHSDSYEEYYFSNSETSANDQCISTSSITDFLTDKKKIPPIFNIQVGSSSSESNKNPPLNMSTNKFPISIPPKHIVSTPKIKKKVRRTPKELNNSSVLLVREVITHVNPKSGHENEYEEEEEIVYMYEEEEDIGEEEEEE